LGLIAEAAGYVHDLFPIGAEVAITNLERLGAAVGAVVNLIT
jgi:hypothetical protein